MSAPPTAPILLASTSPRRREILAQLRIPFDVVAPRYEEAEEDPVAHAVGKARSVLAEADGRPVLGCDTEVVCAGRVYGKPEGPEQAEEMLESLSGRTHEVVAAQAVLRGHRDGGFDGAPAHPNPYVPGKRSARSRTSRATGRPTTLR